LDSFTTLKPIPIGEKLKIAEKDISTHFSPNMFLHQRDFLIDSDEVITVFVKDFAGKTFTKYLKARDSAD
jgi:hypothetical protein